MRRSRASRTSARIATASDSSRRSACRSCALSLAIRPWPRLKIGNSNCHVGPVTRCPSVSFSVSTPNSTLPTYRYVLVIPKLPTSAPLSAARAIVAQLVVRRMLFSFRLRVLKSCHKLVVLFSRAVPQLLSSERESRADRKTPAQSTSRCLSRKESDPETGHFRRRPDSSTNQLRPTRLVQFQSLRMSPAIRDYSEARPARRRQRLEFAGAGRELLLESDYSPQRPFAIRPAFPFAAESSMADHQSTALAPPRPTVAAVSTPRRRAVSFPLLLFLDQRHAADRTFPRLILMDLRMDFACVINFSAHRFHARIDLRRASSIVLHAFHVAHSVVHLLHC